MSHTCLGGFLEFRYRPRIQSLSDPLEAFPRASGFARSSVDDQIVRILRNLWIENIVNHSVGAFDLPILAVKFLACNRRGRRFEL